MEATGAKGQGAVIQLINVFGVPTLCQTSSVPSNCWLHRSEADPTLIISHGWVLSVGIKVWWEYKGRSSYWQRAWVF